MYAALFPWWDFNCGFIFQAIADMVTEENLAEGRLYPPLSTIREVSFKIAVKVGHLFHPHSSNWSSSLFSFLEELLLSLGFYSKHDPVSTLLSPPLFISPSQIVAYAYRHNIASLYPEPKDKEAFVLSHVYSPDYDSLELDTYSWPQEAMNIQDVWVHQYLLNIFVAANFMTQ